MVLYFAHPNATLNMSQKKEKRVIILQIIPSLISGGSERGCLEIAQGLSQAGHKNHIITQYICPSITIPPLTTVHLLPVASKNPLTIIKNAWRIKKTAQQFNVDLLHARSRAPAWSTLLTSFLTQKPYISTCHGCYRASYKLKRWYNRAITTYPRHIIATSTTVKQYINDFYPKSLNKTTVVNRGIDRSTFDPSLITETQKQKWLQQHHLDANRPILLIPGRYTRGKGQYLVIQALASLKHKGVQAVFCGKIQDENYFNDLKNMADKHHVSADIRLLNTIPSLPVAYSIADITICPSTQNEAFGRVPIEAAIMGSTALASKHSGFLETIVEHKTGFFFANEDAHSLAASIQHILALSQHDRSVIQKQATNHINQHYCGENMVKQTFNIYNKCLIKAPVRSSHQ